MDNSSDVKKKCVAGYSLKCAAFYLSAAFSASLLGFAFYRLTVDGADPVWVGVATSVFALWAPAPRPPDNLKAEPELSSGLKAPAGGIA